MYGDPTVYCPVCERRFHIKPYGRSTPRSTMKRMRQSCSAVDNHKCDIRYSAAIDKWGILEAIKETQEKAKGE